MTCNPNTLEWIPAARAVASGIRRRVLEHALAHRGGYVSQACSSAEILATLYLKVMRLGAPDSLRTPGTFQGAPGPENTASHTGAAYNGPRGPEYDRFILSPSQYSLALYAALIELGRMAPEGLTHFNQDGSTVEMIGAEHSPGMEMMTGSLGQGLSQAGGMAWARRRKAEPGRIWVFMSDGEFQIGQTWEALQALAFYRLDNLGIYVDVNGCQCDGRMAAVMNIEPLDQRLEAFGCRVFCVDGHDPESLARPADLSPDGRPLVVLAATDPCRGLERLRRNAPKFHYLRFKSEDERSEYRADLSDEAGHDRPDRSVQPNPPDQKGL